MKILVYETRDHAAHRIASMLSVAGHSVTSHERPAEFLQAAERKSLDFIVVGGAAVHEGAELVHGLRKQLCVSTPVLRLVDAASEQDKIGRAHV